MTVTLQISTVTESIAALDISGINVLDIDSIPDSANLICPVFMPQPNDFITAIAPVFQTLGSNALTPAIDLSYTLNYVFLECEAGSGIGAFDVYPNLIAHVTEILRVILSNDTITGAVDIKPLTIGDLGVLEDAAGNSYWGSLLSFRVLEFVE